jgi:hypothetical protein
MTSSRYSQITAIRKLSSFSKLGFWGRFLSIIMHMGMYFDIKFCIQVYHELYRHEISNIPECFWGRFLSIIRYISM